MLRALTLVADWHEAAGAMAAGFVWCAVIFGWTGIMAFVQDKVRPRVGPVGSKIVLGIAFVGLVGLSAWMYRSDMVQRITWFLVG